MATGKAQSTKIAFVSPPALALCASLFAGSSLLRTAHRALVPQPGKDHKGKEAEMAGELLL
jgi:hypothetical protein